MPITIHEIYRQVIATLPSAERLQLATLILNGLVKQDYEIDDSDTWTDQDQLDFTAFSLQYAVTALPEDEDLTGEL
jgi:hypothetical protein